MKLTFALTLLLLISQNTMARTLQSLARMSNALLVENACQLSASEISQKSQSLHALIDEKAEKLTAGDFKILAERAKTCELDCSCDIYAYALEKREKPNQMMADKAAKTQIADRQKCMTQVKNICAEIKKAL